MNIMTVIIDFEDEAANLCLVPGWSSAIDCFERSTWNPQKKNDSDLAAEGFYGLHIVLDAKFTHLKITVYSFTGEHTKPDYVETVIANTDTHQAHDNKAFIREDLKITSFTLPFKKLFGDMWNKYIGHFLAMSGAFSGFNINRADWMRAQTHNALAEILINDLSEKGLTGKSFGIEEGRGILEMLRDYYFTHMPKEAGNVSQFRDAIFKIK